jgi:HAMP domain-containing protein
VSAAQGAREGEDASGQSWFRRGLDAGVVEFVPAAGGGTNHSIHVAVPVRGPGEKPAGLVVAYLGWDGLGGLRSPLMGPARSLIVGRDGTVLAGTAPARGDPPVLPVSIRAEANRGAWHLERSPDGAEYLAAVSRSSALDYPGPEWRVALFRDAREALSDVGFVQVQIISIGGLLGLAFAGLALWFGARVAEPLTELADAADRLSAGDRALFIPRSSRYAEAERLGASLQSLLSSLRRQEEDLVQARDKLELRVRERSAELVRTRAALEAKIAELERAQRERAPGAPS